MNKKTILGIAVIALMAILVFIACSKSGGGSSGGRGKSLNSATELKEYLDKQPANSPDQPIKVAMKANDMMIKDIAKVIKETGKYVSLDLSGSPLTEIPEEAFYGCKTLAGITIPDSVTSIGRYAFGGTTWLDNQPDGVVYLGKTALTYKGNMLANTSIKLNDGTKGIADWAFEGQERLTSVTIPASVTSIGSFAFANTQSGGGQLNTLTSVTFQGTIPSSGIHEYAFYFGGSLREKYLAEGMGTYTKNGRTWTKQ